VSGEDDVCLALGAYLVGSLVQSERAAFDRHLLDCAECRREAAELGPLLGLLRCVDAAEWCNEVPDASACRGSSMRPVPGKRRGGVDGCGGRRRLWWWRWSRR
jgi:anti-sigma factor RsiW